MEMQNEWETVDKNMGTNYDFALVAVPNQNLIYLDGGEDGSVPQAYKSAIFSLNSDDDDGWIPVTPERSNSTTESPTALLGPDNSTIYVWGGRRFGFTEVVDRYPREMFILSLRNEGISSWSTGPAAELGRSLNAGVLVESSIYYIGGTYTPLNGSGSYSVPMNNALTFDTVSGEWSSHPIGGDVTPAGRYGHTLTLKPSTGEVILFGGWDRGDYFYLLNTQGGDLSWSNRTIQGEDAIYSPLRYNGAFYDHSAVMVGSYLFILFGAVNEPGSGNGPSTNKTWVMDADQWAWISSINAIQPVPLPTSNDTPGQGSDSRDDASTGGLSAGTIAGAVVGAVVGVIIIAAILFFIIRRKRRQLQQEQQNQDEEGIKEEYNNNKTKGSGDNSVDPSGDSPSSPSPPDYGDLEQNNDNHNVQQPLSSKTEHFGTTTYSDPQEEESKKVEILSADYSTDNPKLSQDLSSAASASASHALEKPDGGIRCFNSKPVKPDGE
ncbi:hypothetical protein BDA99DRAFT_560617 [Phascolomyces articulosus]|uniref:Galactose oxidase n=1 Tax=Phascolomyces articulosus TaxID=60185 RepID=A0AAD5K7X5_9FUNG|nr:hypothetical protein BDA99DRAFT_560617 [Phascolomyces articulosus]